MNMDEKLLRMFQARDEQALQAASVQYGKLCRTMAYRILGDRQDAEECANDVLLKLWNAIPPCRAALPDGVCLRHHAESRTGQALCTPHRKTRRRRNGNGTR